MPENSSTNVRDQLYLTENEDRTFQYDDQLPSLPVPDLESSLQRYLESVTHLVSDEQLQKTKLLLIKFAKNEGVELQKALEFRAKSHRNWLEEWWLEFAYLRTRSPLVPFSNVCAPLPAASYWPPQEGELVYRISLILHIQMQFWLMLREERMKPMVHKNVPWSMNQFRRLFNTCRIPVLEKDEMFHGFQTQQEERITGERTPSHVIVMYQGHVYSIETMQWGEKEQILSLSELAEQIAYVLEDNRAAKYGEGVACLTHLPRDKWAKCRSQLIKFHPENAKILHLIESSVMCISFDEIQPNTPSEKMRDTLCGDPGVRWADKSINSIYFRNGLSGASCDHTPFDGFATALMTHFVLTSLEQYKGHWPDSLVHSKHSVGHHGIRANERVQKLDFKLSLDINQSIAEARKLHSQNCERIDLLTSEYTKYGKRLMKQVRVHPEALIQVALQLAYLKLHHLYPSLNQALPTCYCTASTRKFYNGRTETCRSSTKEAMEFAKKVINDPVFSSGHYNLLKKATNKFQNLMEEAMNAQGIDRHFLGLYLMSMEKGMELPEIFTDETFTASGSGGNYVLSTSCSGYWNLTGGVPPMREDGYGIFYGIEEDVLHFTLLAYRDCDQTDIGLMWHEIGNALDDIQQILNKAKL